MLFTFSFDMASASGPTYTKETVLLAVEDVRSNKLTMRKAAQQYGIPKSTLALYISGKLQIGVRSGPASILSPEEEQRIVDYAVHMGQIGYERTREQIFDIVAKIVTKDGRPNPFVDGKPGRKWWASFKKRHPEISLHTPERLQLARAKCCIPEVLGAWYEEFGEFLKTYSLMNEADRIWNGDEAGFSLCATSGKVISICSSVQECLCYYCRHQRANHHPLCHRCSRSSASNAHLSWNKI